MTDSAAASGQSPPADASRGPGAVYAMTNSPSRNEVVAYERATDGRLKFAGRFATGGAGTGDSTATDNPLASQGALILSRDERWLFAANPGSHEISSFRVSRDSLTLVDRVDSGGRFPSSLTQHGSYLYVLNAGGETNIAGLSIDSSGHLAPMANTLRELGLRIDDPPHLLEAPAQVSFTPSGDSLVVCDKKRHQLLVFPVGSDGAPTPEPVVTPSTGSVPFGFAFTEAGSLLVTEAFGSGSAGDADAGALSTYRLEDDHALTVLAASVPSYQTATCAIARRGVGPYAWVANNGSASVSGYRVDDNGIPELIHESGRDALTQEAPVDLAMTPDGRFFYVLNTGAGTISMYRVRSHGGPLTHLGEIEGLPARRGAAGIAAR